MKTNLQTRLPSMYLDVVHTKQDVKIHIKQEVKIVVCALLVCPLHKKPLWVMPVTSYLVLTYSSAIKKVVRELLLCGLMTVEAK